MNLSDRDDIAQLYCEYVNVNASNTCYKFLTVEAAEYIVDSGYVTGKLSLSMTPKYKAAQEMVQHNSDLGKYSFNEIDNWGSSGGVDDFIAVSDGAIELIDTTNIDGSSAIASSSNHSIFGISIAKSGDGFSCDRLDVVPSDSGDTEYLLATSGSNVKVFTYQQIFGEDIMNMSWQLINSRADSIVSNV